MDNIQVNQNIRHKLFTGNRLTNHSLVLYIGRDELSYAVIQESDRMVVHLKSFRLKEAGNFYAYKLLLKDFFEQEDLLKADFKSVSVGLNVGNYTLVPARYFDDSQIEKYYAFNFPQDADSGAQLTHDHIGGVKVMNVYAVDRVSDR